MDEQAAAHSGGSSAPGSPIRPDEPYRVLARKYRPQSFASLIGQDAMVRTLSNAFSTGRIHQAYMLTGVRGVGKTTTARILARGLNYETDTVHAPTVDMPVLGRHCQAIIDSRHIDVMELDAASHNGVADIRQITDGVRYAPVSARYKVLILDEVHMVSGAGFNALLKTLEEPPPHVKFVFATTEIRKVPVTILSRCQRFDLRRVEAGALVKHLAGICEAEGIAIEPEALAMLARAAEGSVRDSLSLLDQAIAHSLSDGAGGVTAAGVRDMLGLADRSRVIDLAEAVVRGDTPAALEELRSQHEAGADPVTVLSSLAEFVHLVTRLKVAPAAARDGAVTEAERVRGGQLAERLSIRALTRLWQMLLKAIGEVQASPRPLASADMALVRLCHAADLPHPDDLIRQIMGGGGAAPRALPVGGQVSATQVSAGPATVQALPRPSPQAQPVQGHPMQGHSMQGQTVQGQTVQGQTVQGQGGPARVPLQAASAGQARAAAQALPAQSIPAPPVAAQPVQGQAAQARPLPVPPPAVQPTQAQPIPSRPAAAPARPGAEPRVLGSFSGVVALAAERRDLALKLTLERYARPVAFEEGRLDLALDPGAPSDLLSELSRKLGDWTGRRWLVALSTSAAPARTLREEAEAREAERMVGVRADPFVRAALERFPGAEIVDVRDVGYGGGPAPAPLSEDGDVLAPADLDDLPDLIDRDEPYGPDDL